MNDSPLALGPRPLALAHELRRYRGWMNDVLARAPEAWIYRRVEWPECCIGWHMGHVAWKLDDYAAQYLGDAASLDSEWKRRFYSLDPLDPAEAPALAELRAVFDETFERFAAGLAHVSDGDLHRPLPGTPDGSLLAAVINLVFHEGEHYAGIESLVSYFKQTS